MNFLLAAVLGIAFAASTFRKPALGLLIVVLLSASIIDFESLPLIPVGVGSLTLTDVVLLSLLILLIFKRSYDFAFTPVPTPLVRPLAVLLAAGVFSAAYAILIFQLDFNRVIQHLRGVLYFGICYLLLNILRERGQIRFLINGLYLIAAFVSLAMLAQAAVGDAYVLVAGRVESAGTFEKEFDTLRILPPGAILVFACFMTCLCSLVMKRPYFIWLSIRFYTLLALLAAIGITYNRNYWVALAVLILLLFALLPGPGKWRLACILCVCVLAGTLAVAGYSVSQSSNGAFLNALTDRFTSLFSVDDLAKSSSLQFRFMENTYALKTMERYPILGMGLGNNYRPSVLGPEDIHLNYIHNGYLWYLMNLGPVGFAGFLWFFFGFVIRGLRAWRRIDDLALKSTALGFALSGIGIMMISFVSPVIMEWPGVVVLAVMSGINEAIIAQATAAGYATNAERPSHSFSYFENSRTVSQVFPVRKPVQ
jgi:hypothetical protein